MSYYKYMVSVYRSQLPLMMNRSSMRTSSSSYSTSYGSNRFTRSSTAPPTASCCDYDSTYYGVMPFNRSLRAIEDRINTRAASMAPVGSYSRSYRSTSPYGGITSFDYKVHTLILYYTTQMQITRCS